MGYDECDYSEYCYVAYVDYEGEYQETDCESFDSYFGDDWSDWSDDETCLYNEGGDCAEMLAGDIENLQYCWFNSTYDYCIEEEIFCNATIRVDDQWYNTTCDEIEEIFEIEDDSYYSGSDECEMMPFEMDCMEGMEEVFDSCWASMTIDTCSGETESCWMEIVMDGVDYSDFCDEIENQFAYSDYYDYCDELDYTEEADCMFMVPEDMMSIVTSCEFEEEFDGCSHDSYWC
jgi:hypothetical protein